MIKEICSWLPPVERTESLQLYIASGNGFGVYL